MSEHPRLMIETAQPPKPVVLTGRQQYVIGRSRDADVSLNDPALSRRHCALTVTTQGVEVEDLGSASGTFINGQPIVGAVRLQPGDRIKVGDTVLRFGDGAPRPAPHPILESEGPATVVRRAGSSSAPPVTLPAPIPLRDRLVIGRDATCDVPLDSREVSRQHAELRREANGSYRVRDLMSTNGTFVNNAEVRGWMPLAEGHRLRIGPYTLILRDEQLLPFNQKGNVRISLVNITKTVRDRTSGQPLRLLDDVSFVIAPNEFVALLGPSGSGKSTLMDAINGRRPANGGRVWINDDDFYASYGYYRRAIGYVPQRDIVHTALTVEQAFLFAAELRLPADTSTAERARIVNDVIRKMGLEQRRRTRIADLSGGQLKRVSLGTELIADPSLLFLDEATSGLDAGTESEMMKLFREVADDGKTVVCITHNLDNVNLCDLVVVMNSGKLAYYGPPDQLPAYFGIHKVAEVYKCLEAQSAEHWEQHYRESSLHETYVRQRLPAKKAPAAGPAAPSGRGPATRDPASEVVRQWWVLTRRYMALMVQDWKNLALLLAQAPIIALLLGMVFGGDRSAAWIQRAQTQQMIVFLLAVSAIWFGCINAAKEIVKELPIYLRERAVNLHLSAYLGSKIIVLAVLCALQCVGLYAITAPLTGLDGDVGRALITLVLTALNGVMMGLVVSALVDNADKALAIVPVLLIPQVIFAGAITKLSGVSEWIGKGVMVAYWSFNALLHTLSSSPRSMLAPTGTWAKDICVLLVFLTVLTVAAIAALRRKDQV